VADDFMGVIEDEQPLVRIGPNDISPRQLGNDLSRPNRFEKRRGLRPPNIASLDLDMSCHHQTSSADGGVSASGRAVYRGIVG
jgi:hypothetical protein